MDLQKAKWLIGELYQRECFRKHRQFDKVLSNYWIKPSSKRLSILPRFQSRLLLLFVLQLALGKRRKKKGWKRGGDEKIKSNRSCSSRTSAKGMFWVRPCVGIRMWLLQSKWEQRRTSRGDGRGANRKKHKNGWDDVIVAMAALPRLSPLPALLTTSSSTKQKQKGNPGACWQCPQSPGT